MVGIIGPRSAIILEHSIHIERTAVEDTKRDQSVGEIGRQCSAKGDGGLDENRSGNTRFVVAASRLRRHHDTGSGGRGNNIDSIDRSMRVFRAYTFYGLSSCMVGCRGSMVSRSGGVFVWCVGTVVWRVGAVVW